MLAIWKINCRNYILSTIQSTRLNSTQLNSTAWVESDRALWFEFAPTQLVCKFFSSSEHFQLSWVESSCQSVQSTRLNSTQLWAEWASVVTQFSSGHVMSTCQYQYHLLNYWGHVWRVQKCTCVWKMELQEGDTLSRLPWIWISIDIYGYLCVDRLRTATEVIGPISGIRIINDFTICVCLKDADIMLLLMLFYAFFFSSYSSFSPNLRSLLLNATFAEVVYNIDYVTKYHD